MVNQMVNRMGRHSVRHLEGLSVSLGALDGALDVVSLGALDGESVG